MSVSSIVHSNRLKRNVIGFHICHRFQGPERKETLKISAESRTEHLTACRIAAVARNNHSMSLEYDPALEK